MGLLWKGLGMRLQGCAAQSSNMYVTNITFTLEFSHSSVVPSYFLATYARPLVWDQSKQNSIPDNHLTIPLCHEGTM